MSRVLLAGAISLRRSACICGIDEVKFVSLEAILMVLFIPNITNAAYAIYDLHELQMR